MLDRLDRRLDTLLARLDGDARPPVGNTMQ
jgi:hypothetical protein